MYYKPRLYRWWGGLCFVSISLEMGLAATFSCICGCSESLLLARSLLTKLCFQEQSIRDLFRFSCSLCFSILICHWWSRQAAVLSLSYLLCHKWMPLKWQWFGRIMRRISWGWIIRLLETTLKDSHSWRVCFYIFHPLFCGAYLAFI